MLRACAIFPTNSLVSLLVERLLFIHKSFEKKTVPVQKTQLIEKYYNGIPFLSYSIYLFVDDGDGKEIVAGFDALFVCVFD